MKNKFVAALLALFLGGLGVHKFYLGNTKMGVIYFLFFWTTLPMWISFVEGVLYIVQDQQSFDAKYNNSIMNTSASMAQSKSQTSSVNVDEGSIVLCPNCNQPLQPNKKFCTSCGYKIN